MRNKDVEDKSVLLNVTIKPMMKALAKEQADSRRLTLSEYISQLILYDSYNKLHIPGVKDLD